MYIGEGTFCRAAALLQGCIAWPCRHASSVYLSVVTVTAPHYNMEYPEALCDITPVLYRPHTKTCVLGISYGKNKENAKLGTLMPRISESVYFVQRRT